MADIITGTPPDLTYGHWLVQQAWMVVWAITSGALVVILGWMGLTFIMSEHLGSRQASWREMVPRLVLGLVAAASSLWWCALVLDVPTPCPASSPSPSTSPPETCCARR